jgi:hypothetical protein
MEVGLSSLMGYGSAKSLAKMYSILANGGELDGKRLLSEELVKTFVVPVNLGLPRDISTMKMACSRGFFVYENSMVSYGIVSFIQINLYREI